MSHTQLCTCRTGVWQGFINVNLGKNNTIWTERKLYDCIRDKFEQDFTTRLKYINQIICHILLEHVHNEFSFENVEFVGFQILIWEVLKEYLIQRADNFESTLVLFFFDKPQSQNSYRTDRISWQTCHRRQIIGPIQSATSFRASSKNNNKTSPSR